MKFVIVLACLLAVAYANEDSTKVLKNEVEVNPDSFHYALELDNSIKAEQHGELKDKDNWLVHGEYEYVSKHGKHHKVTYVADEHGYQPKIEI